MWTTLLLACTAFGSETTESASVSEPPQNVVSLRGALSWHVLEEGERADHVGGVILSYERVLVDERLSLVLAKPFMFGSNRFDSAFETSLKLMNRWGVFEPFLVLGYGSTLRVFSDERREKEGFPSALSLGVIGAAGLTCWFAEATGVEIELGVTQIVAGPVVDREVTASAGMAFAF